MFDAQLMKTFTDVKTGIGVICELSEHCRCNVSLARLLDSFILIKIYTLVSNIMLQGAANVSCASNHADTR